MWSTVKYVFALIVVFCTAAPFLWLIISSLEPTQDLYSVPVVIRLRDFSFSRYAQIFQSSDPNSPAYVFRHAMGNSIEIAIVVTVVCLIVGFFAAYAFARLNFRFKRSLLFSFLFTYMVPSISLVMPLYIIFSRAGMLDSKFTLMLVYSSFVLPYTVWVLQGYLVSVPGELEEAARVDGCTYFGAIIRVIVPVVIPAIIATAVFALLLAWDEFLYALILTSTIHAQTISVTIASFVGKNVADFGMIATGGVLAALPPTIFALLFQRFIVGGMTAGSVKG
ncbi:carbohydrate ABC transporter permease [Alicyclobacillaceae bacterium I2511]|nr:carbohydrate ABC transporter permease [Alicyclobacillaceae bacterium I2511]